MRTAALSINMDAIVLAGAPAEAGMTPMAGYTSRGMVEVAGKTMLQRLVDALKESGQVERIIVVGDAAAKGVDTVVPPAGGFLENIMLGLEHAGPGRYVLVSSCDIPLVSPEAIADFVTRAVETGGDFCYPIIPREDCLAKYPRMARTYLKLREGTFTGGNMVLVSPEFMRRNEETIGRAYSARKNVFALAGMIGFGVLVRAALSQLLWPGLLSIAHLERSVGRMLGGEVRAVITPYAEIGEDVDKLSDLQEVERLLGLQC